MYASAHNSGTLLSVWVQPRASRSALIGIYADSIKIAVKSPPVEGKANEECVELLADILGLPRQKFAIKSGHQGRRKGVFVKGVDLGIVVSGVENAIKKLGIK